MPNVIPPLTILRYRVLTLFQLRDFSSVFFLIFVSSAETAVVGYWELVEHANDASGVTNKVKATPDNSSERAAIVPVPFVGFPLSEGKGRGGERKGL